MVFRRKIYDKLLEWKKRSDGHTAVLIEGARRVGKSFVAKQFGGENYRSCAMIDFARPKKRVVEAILQHPDDIDRIFNTIQFEYNVVLHERDSLIVFDEVQRCPEARQLIKYLVADGRYDYIETGSLVSIKMNIKDITIPSEEEAIELPPMDFEEFCTAMGDMVTFPYIKEKFGKREPMGESFHETVMARFCEYLCVGGMPQVVEDYINHRNLARADGVKRTILRLYHDDIAKFAGGYAGKVRRIFEEIPGQLSKKEKKYVLSSISKSARMREYEDAFMWLWDAKIVNPCFNATDPAVGLRLSSDFATQKLYMGDTGLLMAMVLGEEGDTSEKIYRGVYYGDVYFNKGMIAENAVAQAFRANGRDLYFYSRSTSETRKNGMEIDFLIRRGDKICPVEVKSGNYRSHSSLDKFVGKFGKRIGEPLILYTKDVMGKDGIMHLPLYMASLL